MSLTAITLRNWRSFKEQRLELRPLTLIYGDNNAGKSALLRAVVALSEHATGANGGLNWSAEVLRNTDFASLLRKGIGADEEQVLGWTLHTEEGIELSCEVKWWASWDEAVLSRFEARRGEAWVRFEWIPIESELMEPLRSYSFSSDQVEATPTKTSFHMMLPMLRELTDVQNVQFQRVWGEPSYMDKVGMGMVQWLRAGRVLPQLTARQRRLMPWLTTRGLGALELLDRSEDVFKWVQRRFELCTKGDQQGYQLRLVHPDAKNVKAVAKRGALEVDATELGDGVQGLIPTLTALGWMACGSAGAVGVQEDLDLDGNARRLSGPKILALEEPESQLHPTLQRALGEAVCEAVKEIKEAQAGRKLLIETHSDVLLMTVQVAIARGEIAPEDVAIYWVAQDEATGVSEARRLTVNVNGTLGGLPRKAFRQKIDLSGDLLKAIPAVLMEPGEDDAAVERRGGGRGR
jgi:predicted ATPase